MEIRTVFQLIIGIILLVAGGWTAKNKVPDSKKSMEHIHKGELFLFLAISLITLGVLLISGVVFLPVKPPGH